MTNKIYGRLDPFFETGTEGVNWSLSSKYLPGYDGLFSIKNKTLSILAYDNVTPLWSGIVELEYERLKTSSTLNPNYSQQAIFNYWVHGFEKTLAPEMWATFFFERRRAILEETVSHPFIGDSLGMKERLESLLPQDQLKLYNSTIYPWLNFCSDESHYSYADSWGFNLKEICQLLGSVSDEQITALKTYPKQFDDMPIPYSIERFTRIALLYGIYGGVDWRYNTTEENIHFFASISRTGESIKDLLLQQDLSGIIRVRDWLDQQNGM